MLATALITLGKVPHPTLPDAWTATVNEDGVGVVYESYLMVDKVIIL